MAYIGNGRTLLVLGSNVRDDLVPGYNPGTSTGPFDKTTFNLSQEVPGGYEGNIYVFRQTYIFEKLIQSNSNGAISIRNVGASTFEVYSSDDAIAAALSSIRESLRTFTDSDHTLTISGSATAANNNRFTIENCVYNGTEIVITLTKVGSVVADNASQLTLSHGYSGFWEVLEPETDYTIGGTGSNLNKQITLTKAPQLNDTVYVIHKGDATYNLVPSDNSVGPNQLTQNLRDFVKQTATGNGSTTTFTLTQNSINSKAILVTVNGVVQEGEEWDGVAVSANSDYALNTNVEPNTIIFRVAPINTAKIRILHLGFSTVSRRSVLSPGQVGSVSNNSIGTAQLQNDSVTSDKLQNSSVTVNKLSNSSVTNAKLADDSVTSNKILLLNNTSIRSLLTDGITVQNILSVDASDTTILNAASQVSVSTAGTKRVNFNSSSITPETTNVTSLGSSTYKFSDLHLSGTANVNNISAIGNITVSGTVDGVDISEFQNSINNTISNLTNLIDTIIPIGTIVPYSGTAVSGSTINGKWLLCDGAEVSRTTYSSLNSLLSSQGYPFGNGNASTTFTLPDMRRRVPIGRTDADSIGNNDGLLLANRALSHTHTVPAHNHDLSNHTHNLPGHYHEHNTTLGSSINIVSSGGHTTNIDISHAHNLTATSTSLSANSNNANISINSNTTGITMGYMDSTSEHGHSIAEHQHVYVLPISNSTGSNANTIARGGTLAENKSLLTSPSGVLTAANTNTDHRHPITDPGHSHEITQTAHSHTISDHTHTINGGSLGTTTRSDTGGTHLHTAANFNGSIGNVNSLVNGNITGGTNISGSPSVNLTGNSSVLTSGNSSTGVNTPYLIVNYIIRAL